MKYKIIAAEGRAKRAHMETVHGDRPYGAKEQHTFTGHRIYQSVLTLKSGEMVYRDMTF